MTTLNVFDLAHGICEDYGPGAVPLSVDEYRSGVPRWCTGCGANGILAEVLTPAQMELYRSTLMRPEQAR